MDRPLRPITPAQGPPLVVPGARSRDRRPGQRGGNEPDFEEELERRGGAESAPEAPQKKTPPTKPVHGDGEPGSTLDVVG